MTTTLEKARKVLLVEDEKIAQRVNKMLLEQLGCVVDIAENGQQALDRAQQYAYDLIFMDIGLPDINGIDVTVKLRDWEKGKARRTPIVAFTAYTLQEVEKNCLSADMDSVITKPTSIGNLQQTIAQFAVEAAEENI